MKHLSLNLCAMLILFSKACKKDRVITCPVEALGDIKTIRLKEIFAEKLPPPYFSFSYNDSGYVTGISFADSLFVYAATYKNLRIDKLVTPHNNSILQYEYTAGSVTGIKQVFANFNKFRRFIFKYNNQKQLVEAIYLAENTNDPNNIVRKVIMVLC